MPRRSSYQYYSEGAPYGPPEPPFEFRYQDGYRPEDRPLSPPPRSRGEARRSSPDPYTHWGGGRLDPWDGFDIYHQYSSSGTARNKPLASDTRFSGVNSGRTYPFRRYSTTTGGYHYPRENVPHAASTHAPGYEADDRQPRGQNKWKYGREQGEGEARPFGGHTQSRGAAGYDERRWRNNGRTRVAPGTSFPNAHSRAPYGEPLDTFEDEADSAATVAETVNRILLSELDTMGVPIGKLTISADAEAAERGLTLEDLWDYEFERLSQDRRLGNQTLEPAIVTAMPEKTVVNEQHGTTSREKYFKVMGLDRRSRFWSTGNIYSLEVITDGVASTCTVRPVPHGEIDPLLDHFKASDEPPRSHQRYGRRRRD